jgi:hypothetical protein
VLDETYRKAMVLPAERFATNFDLAEYNILADVKELLMPEIALRIRARRDKLNVYGPEAFFDVHQVHTHHGCAALCTGLLTLQYRFESCPSSYATKNLTYRRLSPVLLTNMAVGQCKSGHHCDLLLLRPQCCLPYCSRAAS